MLPDLKNLINEVEYFYNSTQIKEIKDAEINENLKNFTKIYTDLENKFIDTAIFPYNLKLIKKAENIYKKELNQDFDN